MTSNTGENLVSIYFTDANTGYVVGSNSTILKTEDGGLHWSSSNTGIPAGKSFSDIGFLGDSLGYVVGYYEAPSPVIYKTGDAGNSWTATANQLPAEIDHLHSLHYNSIVIDHDSIAYLTADSAGSAYNHDLHEFHGEAYVL